MYFMVAAIRKIVTVSPDGILRIHDTELVPGSRAEVIVLLTTVEADSVDTPPSALSAWDALQRGVAIDAPTAAQWKQAAHAERKRFGSTE
jgi:hypothetical protein